MSLPPEYVAAGRRIVDAVAPQCDDAARRFGPEQARRSALDVLDTMLARTPEEQRPKLACAAGCAYCCHRQVAVGAAEVFALVDHLRETLDAAAFEAFRERCIATATRVAPMPQGQRALQSIACPVLVDGACTGYAARPFRCRAYNSLDVEPCRRFFDAPRAGDPGPPADLGRYVVAQAAMFGLYTGLAQAGFDPRQYELATALAEALADSEAVMRYARRERAFLRAVVLG